LQLLGIFRGFAVTGCELDEMGIGLVFAIPKLLKKTGQRMGDIVLRELKLGICSPGNLLRRQTRHPAGASECKCGRDHDRSSLWRFWCPLDRACADQNDRRSATDFVCASGRCGRTPASKIDVRHRADAVKCNKIAGIPEASACWAFLIYINVAAYLTSYTPLGRIASNLRGNRLQERET
jgi:hypothetical protein